MPTVNFTIKYPKNTGLVLSSTELVSQYLFGLPLCTRDGRQIESSVISQKIANVQLRLERYLMLKFRRQWFSEQRDFMRGDYFSWGYTSLSFPIVEPISLTGWINSTKQTTFPLNWCSTYKSSEEDQQTNRNLHIVPGGDSSPTTNSVVFLGIVPNLNYLGMSNIPNYWTVEYITGFKKVPADILDAVGKMAAIEILAIIGDLILHPGISATSLSFDGLSESLTTTKSGQTSAYSARMKQYSDDLRRQVPDLKNFYKGISYMTM